VPIRYAYGNKKSRDFNEFSNQKEAYAFGLISELL
jgi:hypothetical protein